MIEIFKKVFEYEQDPEVIDISVVGGFAYADVYCAGMKTLVTVDNNRKKAEEISVELINFIQELKKEYRVNLYDIGKAVTATKTCPDYPVIFVESSDNVGGGAPADATHVLEYLIKTNVEKFITFIYDPEAVEEASSLGINGEFDYDVGGKTDKRFSAAQLHGNPVRVKGRVCLLSEGCYVNKGPHMTGKKNTMGKTAVIEVENCHQSTIILTEKRASPRDINQFLILGLNPDDYNIIVMKSAVAWRTIFSLEPKHVFEIDTPGSFSSNLSHFEYRNLPEYITKV